MSASDKYKDKRTQDTPQPDPVDESEQESFPASDPPAHNPDPLPESSDEEQEPIDVVEQASKESFPASDAPGWISSESS